MAQLQERVFHDDAHLVRSVYIAESTSQTFPTRRVRAVRRNIVQRAARRSSRTERLSPFALPFYLSLSFRDHSGASCGKELGLRIFLGYGGGGSSSSDQHPAEATAAELSALVYYLFPANVWIMARHHPSPPFRFRTPRHQCPSLPSLRGLRFSVLRVLICRFSIPKRTNRRLLPADRSTPSPPLSSRFLYQPTRRSRVAFLPIRRDLKSNEQPYRSPSLCPLFPPLRRRRDPARCFPFVFRPSCFFPLEGTNLPCALTNTRSLASVSCARRPARNCLTIARANE